MASQARNNENEVPNQRKLTSPWNSKSGHLSPGVSEHLGLYPGPIPRTHVVEQRISLFNRRLFFMNKTCDYGQWLAFVEEFFEPTATLSISLVLEDGVNRFRVNRSLMSRFFMEYFECVLEPQFCLNNMRVQSSNNFTHCATIDCPYGTLKTIHPLGIPGVAASFGGTMGAPFNPDFSVMVRLDCRFLIEFMVETQRFRNFSFYVRSHQEYIPRHMARDFGSESSWIPKTNMTRSGIPNRVINFLRTCNQLAPMQDLMVRHKQMNLSPRDSLRAVVYDKFQQLTNQPQRPPNGRPSPPVTDVTTTVDRTQESEFQKPVVKQRRRRKQPDASTVPPKKGNRKGNQQPPAYEATLEMTATSPMSAPIRFNGRIPHETEDHGMMMVGSPVIMGTSIKVEEERLISKLDNTSLFPEDNSISAFSPQGCSPTTPRF